MEIPKHWKSLPLQDLIVAQKGKKPIKISDDKFINSLPYLDIVREVKNAVDVPVSVYNISGEYAMIKAAAKMGWIDENKAILETLTSFKRAGADLIATYFAKDACKLLS